MTGLHYPQNLNSMQSSDVYPNLLHTDGFTKQHCLPSTQPVPVLRATEKPVLSLVSLSTLFWCQGLSENFQKNMNSMQE